MNGKWFLGIFLIYMFGTLCSTLVEQTWFNQTVLANLLNPEWLNLGTYPSRLAALSTITTFDFAFFKNTDGTPNDLWPLRYLLFGLSAMFWINVILYVSQSIAGMFGKLFSGGVPK